MRTGSCLCGKIQYEIRGPLGRAVFCHCSRCRKANGSVVAFNAPVAAQDFVVTAGEAQLKAFEAPAVHRYFCANCGSQIISRRVNTPDVLRLRLGTLDVPLATGPQAHIFVESKLDWFDICDDAPQFEQAPPPEFLQLPAK